MSVSGSYDLKIETPMGTQRGRMTLKADGGALSGELSNPLGTIAFAGGTVADGDIAFDTRIPTPIGRLKAHVTGRVEGDRFSGSAKLPLGSARIAGERSN